MQFLQDLLYDLLIISLFLKLLWDRDVSLLPRGLVAAGVVGLPFLLGIGGRKGITIIRIGMSITSLIIFLTYLPPESRVLYYTMLSISALVYLWSRLARKALSILIAALIVVFILLYLTKIQ